MSAAGQRPIYYVERPTTAVLGAFPPKEWAAVLARLEAAIIADLAAFGYDAVWVETGKVVRRSISPPSCRDETHDDASICDDLVDHAYYRILGAE